MNALHEYQPREYLDAKTYEGRTEWRAQEEIIALVKIFGRDRAREKVAHMLIVAFKETGR